MDYSAFNVAEFETRIIFHQSLSLKLKSFLKNLIILFTRDIPEPPSASQFDQISTQLKIIGGKIE